MQIIPIPELENHEVTVYQLKHGIVASFPMRNTLVPILLSVTDGRTWSVVAKGVEGQAVWQSEENELQGLKLDAAITKMHKDCKFGNPDKMIEVAHILMVRSLKGF